MDSISTVEWLVLSMISLQQSPSKVHLYVFRWVYHFNAAGCQISLQSLDEITEGKKTGTKRSISLVADQKRPCDKRWSQPSWLSLFRQQYSQEFCLCFHQKHGPEAIQRHETRALRKISLGYLCRYRFDLGCNSSCYLHHSRILSWAHSTGRRSQTQGRPQKILPSLWSIKADRKS